MADVVMIAAGLHGPFVNGRGDHGVNLARKRQLPSLLYELDRCSSRPTSYLAGLHFVRAEVLEIKDEAIDPTHVFPLSQVYEGLLLKMSEKGNDGGQFFTPREVIRAIVQTIDPKVGEALL